MRVFLEISMPLANYEHFSSIRHKDRVTWRTHADAGVRRVPTGGGRRDEKGPAAAEIGGGVHAWV